MKKTMLSTIVGVLVIALSLGVALVNANEMKNEYNNQAIINAESAGFQTGKVCSSLEGNPFNIYSSYDDCISEQFYLLNIDSAYRGDYINGSEEFKKGEQWIKH